MAKKRKVFEGVVVDVCCHRVSFWYDISPKVCEDTANLLTSHAEERAKECIIEGCSSGELNCYLNRGEREVRGWWNIEKD